jgi:large subunit ribosomal protein L19
MAQYFTYNETEVATGDTVRIHQEIVEGDKKRIQIFEGIVIAIKNRGNGKSFTVRKVGANGIGVEKIFPVNAPSIQKLEVKRKGDVRRSKLYFLRDRLGKAATRIKEKATHTKAAK